MTEVGFIGLGIMGLPMAGHLPKGGFVSRRIREVHGQRMIDRAFDPDFRIELHQTQLNLAPGGTRAPEWLARHEIATSP